MYLIYVRGNTTSITDKVEDVGGIILKSVDLMVGNKSVFNYSRNIQDILSRSLVLKHDMNEGIFNLPSLYHIFVYGNGKMDGVTDVTRDFIKQVKTTKPTSTNVVATVSNRRAKSFGSVVKVIDGSTKADIENLKGSIGKVAVLVPRLGKVYMSADSLSDVKEEVVETTTTTYEIVGDKSGK